MRAVVAQAMCGGDAHGAGAPSVVVQGLAQQLDGRLRPVLLHLRMPGQPNTHSAHHTPTRATCTHSAHHTPTRALRAYALLGVRAVYGCKTGQLPMYLEVLEVWYRHGHG